MNKRDWSLLGEFTFSMQSVDLSTIGLFHSKCKSYIKIEVSRTTSVSHFVRELIKHKVEDCTYLQKLKSKITIYDEVDNG